jgi:hypothetical protein
LCRARARGGCVCQRQGRARQPRCCMRRFLSREPLPHALLGCRPPPPPRNKQPPPPSQTNTQTHKQRHMRTAARVARRTCA